MTRTDHLLWIVAEEGAEVAQRASKAARFSLPEVQPGQEATNGERIMQEFADLMGVIEMLVAEDSLAWPADFDDLVRAKQAKVEHYLKHSAANGRLDIAIEEPHAREHLPLAKKAARRLVDCRDEPLHAGR